MSIFESISGRRRILVMENQRAVALYRGEAIGIYGPGVHHLPNRRDALQVETHDLVSPVFSSVYEKALFDRMPRVAGSHLTVFRTGKSEVMIVERDGRIFDVVGPDQKLVVWTDAGPWNSTAIDVSEDIALAPDLARRLVQARKTQAFVVHQIQEGQTGLLSIDGRLAGRLEPGVHAFWSVGKSVQVRAVDLKRQAMDVAGQELLTRDKVTIRVNISAEYQVVDPMLAVGAVKDFADTLYRALQLAFRKTLGTMTLDQILEKKVSIDAEAAEKVRADMAAIGIAVSDIALKDVILPGEMRDILNQVVAAEKLAEANVIRRREETNATRSLLNTAKVMAENPVMLRLKELEALESIAGKVERLTVMNGTTGLLNDLVRLREV